MKTNYVNFWGTSRWWWVLLVVGILLFVPGAAFCWIIDFVSKIVWKKPMLIA